MEILFLITIIIVVLAYLNFKDYLYNPSKRPTLNPANDDSKEAEDFRNYEDIYKTKTKEEKIQSSEYGILIALMAKVAGHDGKVCDLERELVGNTIEDIATQITMQSATYQKSEISAILYHIFENTTKSIEELTQEYAALTKGQYKTRLKLIEYLLALAYADGVLEHNEREAILDIAAYLEIENEDFNRLYDEFAQFYAKESKEASLEEAYKILGVSSEDSFEEIKKAYKTLIKEYHPDILHHKGLEESIIKNATTKLQEINVAYELIKKHHKEQQ